jgi:hypothetical protein
MPACGIVAATELGRLPAIPPGSGEIPVLGAVHRLVRRRALSSTVILTEEG